MVKFLTTRGTTSEIESIINNAKNRIVLVSPYIRIPETLFQSIQIADKRNVKTTVVYGKRELKSDVLSNIRSLNNLLLFYHKDLHAKCYLSESEAIITSQRPARP